MEEHKTLNTLLSSLFATNHLKNTLYPERARLQKLIDIDVELVRKTNLDMAKATRERAAAKKKYDSNVAESDATLEAVKECQKLLRGLQRGGGSFVQIKQAQRHVAKFAKKLTVSKAWGHLAKALVEMS